jgi:hypothetical protein
MLAHRLDAEGGLATFDHLGSTPILRRRSMNDIHGTQSATRLEDPTTS